METKPDQVGVPNPVYDIEIIVPEGNFTENGEIVIRSINGHPLGLFLPKIIKTEMLL